MRSAAERSRAFRHNHLVPRLCVDCSSTITRNGIHGRFPKRCNDCRDRREKSRHKSDYEALVAERLSLAPTRRCVVCSADFKATGLTHRRCHRCRDARLYARACKECGSVFFSGGSGYCTQQCKDVASHRKPRRHKRKQLSRRLRFEVLARDHFTCRYCGRSAPNVPLEVDHILPVAEGGTSTRDNLLTACHDCNSGKRDRVIQKLINRG